MDRGPLPLPLPLPSDGIYPLSVLLRFVMTRMTNHLVRLWGRVGSQVRFLSVTRERGRLFGCGTYPSSPEEEEKERLKVQLTRSCAEISSSSSSLPRYNLQRRGIAKMEKTTVPMMDVPWFPMLSCTWAVCILIFLPFLVILPGDVLVGGTKYPREGKKDKDDTTCASPRRNTLQPG